MKKYILLGFAAFVFLSVLTVFFIIPKNASGISAIQNSAAAPSTNESPKYLSTLSIEYLRNLNIDSPAPQIEEELSLGSNYKRYIASYESDGNKIYGLLTVPLSDAPEKGFQAIVFNHGYIPPSQYSTIENYSAYVDYLASRGFVVFKIDLRGHGKSEGSPTGSYFSPGYTIDAVSAVKSLQKFSAVNPQRIGIWGHSMAGNLVLRALLVSSDIKAGVIWAGAVYSYEDFARYRISDNSYVRRPDSQRARDGDLGTAVSAEVQKLRENPEEVDFNSKFWSEISLTQNIGYLKAPLQIHHSVDDSVVNIGYTRDLERILSESSKDFSVYEYPGGGHNISSPYFDEAMSRTAQFFKENL